jgi:hypothetical protein
MSKHAYTNGLVIIKCDGCTKLHLISDRIGWFTDKSANNDGVDVERLLREKGESVAKQVNGHEEEHAIKQLLEQHKKK